MVLVGAFEGIDEDQSLVCRDEPRPDISHADVIEVVKDFEGRQVLQSDVIGLPAKTLGARLGRLSRGVNVRDSGPQQARDHND
jgi:hypothetical protein